MGECYYLLYGNLIGKKDEKGDFLYINGQWTIDSKHEIGDCLMGYDSTEDEGSPYAMGNTEIMDKIESISKEDAQRFIDEHTNTKPTTDKSEKKNRI